MNQIQFDRVPEAPQGLPLTDIYEENAQFPGVCSGQDGLLYAHWQSHQGRQDQLKYVKIGDSSSSAKTISGDGQVLYPVSLGFRGRIWYAWSEALDNRWQLKVRSLKDDQPGQILLIEEGDSLLYPCLFTYDQELYLLWTRQGKGKSQAVMCRLDEEGAHDREVVSQVQEAYRAKACQGGDGRLYLVYDGLADGQYGVYARVKAESGWSQERRIDRSSAWACDPYVITSPQGATVCWYTFDYDAVYTVMSSELTADAGGLNSLEAAVISEGVGWYLDLAAASNSHGLQVVAYTWSKNDILVRWKKDQGDWSQPACVSYMDGHCAVHPCLTVLEDGTILLAWQYALKNGHYDRNAQVVLTRFTTETIDRMADPSLETRENSFCIPIQANRNKTFASHSSEQVTQWLTRNGYEGKLLLFGDIHGQSNISDGMGFIDQYYHRARDRAKLDFVALTDHDCYPDWLSQSEWELMRTTNRLMNHDGELSCILAYEWTPNEYRYDYGHKNVYYRTDEGDAFRSGEYSGVTPYTLYDSISAYEGFCVAHHPAADWGHVSAATDWDFFDPAIQRLCEIYSRHAPYEDHESHCKFTKNIKKMPGRSVQDGLAKGHRFGFTAGSDSHQMEHGVEGGIVAVFADEHKRECIWDALYDRLCYGTTGARILMSMKVNGVPMGGELSLLKTAPVLIEIDVLGTDALTVELVKNNKTIASFESTEGSCQATYRDEDRGDCDYYYLRVKQADDHKAWCSPVWVDGI